MAANTNSTDPIPTPGGRPTPELVLLGADIGVYAIARAFHEEYGTIATAICRTAAGPIKGSKIIEAIPLGEGAEDGEIIDALLHLAGQRPNARPHLMANADKLIRLIDDHRAELDPHYVIDAPLGEVLDEVSDKAQFARLCDRLDIPTPRTEVVDLSLPQSADIEMTEPGTYVVKAARSDLYASLEMAGKQKVYILDDSEVQPLLIRMREAGYRGEVIVQDFIEGGDTQMRSVTLRREADGRISLVGVARVLVEEHTPSADGNPAAMVTAGGGEYHLAGLAERLLEEVGYVGFANFDVKVAPDGSPLFLELNPRVGRNSYYLTGGGANIARAVVERTERLHPRAGHLYSILPRDLLLRHVPEDLRDGIRDVYRTGNVSHPLALPGEPIRHRSYRLIAGANQRWKMHRYPPRSTP